MTAVPFFFFSRILFVCLFFPPSKIFVAFFFPHAHRWPIADASRKKSRPLGFLGIVWSFFLKAWTSQKSVIAHVALLAVVHLAAVSVTRRQRGNGCDFINQPATDDDVSSWLRSALLLFCLDCFFLSSWFYVPFSFHPSAIALIRYSIEHFCFPHIHVIWLNIHWLSLTSSGFDTSPPKWGGSSVSYS